MQELMPNWLTATLPPLYVTEGDEEPAAVVHLFSCVSGWDWYVTEYDATTGEAFGLVRGFGTEWRYFSVREMEELNRSRGFNVVERDEGFEPRPACRFE